MTYLSDRAIEELTGKVRPSAQVRALRAMEIPHQVRPDGSPAVHEADARPWTATRRPVTREEEPDYAALHG